MRKMLGKYVYARKIPSLVGLLPVSSSLTQHSPGFLCFPHDQNGQRGGMRWRHFILCPSYRGTHTERWSQTHFLAGQKARFKTKKGPSQHLFTPSGPQSRTKGLYQLKNLRMLEGLPDALSAEGSPSFLSALLGPMPTPLCEWLAGIKKCGKSLRYQVCSSCDRRTQFEGRKRNKRSHPILVLSCTPPSYHPQPPSATQFRATYHKPSPAIFSQAPHLCSLGLGQVDSSTADLKLLLFQRSALGHCYRGFIWCNYSNI